MDIAKKEVTEEDIRWAKKKVRDFEKTDKGDWRYEGVEAWKGVVGGKKIYEWLKEACGKEVEWNDELDTSGKVDDWDYMVEDYKLEGKTATKDFHRWITPKVPVVESNPKDFYIGAKYIDSENPNEVHVFGYATLEEVKKCGIDQMKGAKFYQVPLEDLNPLDELIERLDE